MTKEEFEQYGYTLKDYARDCFNGREWTARNALHEYGVGVAPIPPTPEIEDITAQQIIDYLLNMYYSAAHGTNILLSRILARLTDIYLQDS